MSVLSSNIARFLPAMAAQQPDTPALKVPRGRSPDGRIEYLTLSFAELDREVDAWVQLLQTRGVRQNDRVLLMVRQGLPLIAAAFALFKYGAVPVVIDPGMGLGSFLRCVGSSQPRVLLGIPLARIVSRFFPRAFRSVQVRVPASGSALARLSPRGAFAAAPSAVPIVREAEDLAAILFTSGSTGAPKGVCYEHGMFEAQVMSIQATYAIEPGEIDLPMLPIFALFNPALGMTTIVPEIDPTRPAAVDPKKIVQAIQQEGVTNSFGSPTLWNKIATYCEANEVSLPSMRRVLCAGAPVPAELWRRSKHFLSRGELHSPYGATESLPVSTISAREVDPQAVRGACVGRPVAGVRVRVIQMSEAPLADLSETSPLPVGSIGEFIVSGPFVTRDYDALPDATRLAKIAEDHRPAVGAVPGARTVLWHRLGDCGYIDEEGRLWFCGRKVERVETPEGALFTEPCEQVFRSHTAVERCALIGLGKRGAQVPGMVIQRRPLRSNPPLSDEALARELRALAREHPHTAQITRYFFHPNFPVDVRHNAKIHRLTLAKWAAKRKPVEVP